MKIIVDFEGYFNYKKQFYFKEICFYNYDDKTFKNYFIKSNSINYNKNYKWLFKYLHFIPFYFGKTKYLFIQQNYFNYNPDIEFLVKSEDKQIILSNYTRNKIINLDIVSPISYLAIPVQQVVCELDKHNENINFCHCSLRKVNKLVHYLDGV